MRKVIVTVALVLAAAMAGTAEAPLNISGDYLEVRSCNVYTGACHYSDEVVTAGREATLAWNIAKGSYHGVPLEGLKVIAVISAKSNLALDTCSRKSVLYIDSKATLAQQQALKALFTKEKVSLLGKLVDTKVVPISFVKNGSSYSVRAADVVVLDASTELSPHTTYNPRVGECNMPRETWYKPLETSACKSSPGKATQFSYKDKGLSVTWSDKVEANSAFIGSFSM